MRFCCTHRGHRSIPARAIWNGEEEAEAAWLAGALLISDEAAMRIAKAAQPTSLAAEEYGVSEKMVIFRLRVTGARIRVERAQRYYRGPD
jgi:Zn-dependent peptidase ImmA (M78 family)